MWRRSKLTSTALSVFRTIAGTNRPRFPSMVRPIPTAVPSRLAVGVVSLRPRGRLPLPRVHRQRRLRDCLPFGAVRRLATRCLSRPPKRANTAHRRTAPPSPPPPPYPLFHGTEPLSLAPLLANLLDLSEGWSNRVHTMAACTGQVGSSQARVGYGCRSGRTETPIKHLEMPLPAFGHLIAAVAMLRPRLVAGQAVASLLSSSLDGSPFRLDALMVEAELRPYLSGSDALAFFSTHRAWRPILDAIREDCRRDCSPGGLCALRRESRGVWRGGAGPIAASLTSQRALRAARPWSCRFSLFLPMACLAPERARCGWPFSYKMRGRWSAPTLAL